MNKFWNKLIPAFLFFTVFSSAFAWDKGIYLTQYMLENPEKLNYFIREAKATGINTFVVDHEYFSSKYAPAIAKVKAAGIKDVARIVVFSDGGNYNQVHSREHWEKIYKLVDSAINAGADAVQLDYIRYSSKQPANPQHAKDVYEVIKWFKNKISSRNVPMEIDIFGEVSYHPSLHIGQDLKMFADSVDGVNPMVYPSHFWPYQKYSADPYKTVNDSLNALVGHFDNKVPFKVHAFIEAVNYHYIKKTSKAEKQKYLLQQIRAVEEANGVSGWYVWSANNVYENLFHVLRNNKIKSDDSPPRIAHKTKNIESTIKEKKDNSADTKTQTAESPIKEKQAKSADAKTKNIESTTKEKKDNTADTKTKTAESTTKEKKDNTADAKTKTAESPNKEKPTNASTVSANSASTGTHT
jgi:hypothetical protein